MLRRLLIIVRRTVLILLGFALVAVLARVGFRFLDERDRLAFAQRSPIAAGLPNRFSDGEAEFQRRAKERFPVGSSVNEMIHTLAAQGFARNPKRSRKLQELILTPGPGYFNVCTLEWSVAWDAVDDKLTSVSTRYGGRPCL
jgi:hypothetical protein